MKIKLDKKIFIAFDHAVEHGLLPYKNVNMDPMRIAKISKDGGADGVMMHIGAMKYVKENSNYLKGMFKIVKLTAKTPFSEKEKQNLITSVKEASEIADAVAYTVYIGSPYEDEMLRELPHIKDEAKKYGLPLMGFMYPRTKNRYHVDVIQYATRLGSELGFDFIKTYYTGSRETFSEVVKTSFRPVFAAGGPPKDMKHAVQMAKDVMAAGAAGMTVGRTIWMNEKPSSLLKKVAKIIHEYKRK